jgi:tetratricopeptide (TPR) repeat protein
VALAEQLTPYVAAAVGAYGETVLAAGPDPGAGPDAALGRLLLLEIYGSPPAGRLPASVVVCAKALAAEPGNADARDALEKQVHSALHDDDWLNTVTGDMLASFYRREIKAGNTEAMVGLGDLLRSQGNPEGARAAYQQAIDWGDTHAIIDLARLLRGDLGDTEAAQAALERAAGSGDTEVALEALIDLGNLLVLFQGDADRARSAFEEVIRSGHAQWAPEAMVGLARLLQKQGDATGARASYQQAIDSANTEASARASVFLERMGTR